MPMYKLLKINAQNFAYPIITSTYWITFSKKGKFKRMCIEYGRLEYELMTEFFYP